MMVLAHPRDLDKARVRSLLAEAITAPQGKGSSGPEAGSAQKKLSDALAAARVKHPDDPGLLICEALRAISSDEKGPGAPAVARLVELVNHAALEPLEPGERANARQRAVAARQIPLWLVARACWNQEKSGKGAEIAKMFAERAFEAARRQTDNTFYLAMIREQGERAIEKGDRTAAAAAWGQMLEIVVSPPRAKLKKPVQAPAVPPAGKTGAPAAGKRAAVRSGASLPGKRESIVRLASYRARTQGSSEAAEKKKAESRQAGVPAATTVRQRATGTTGQPGPARKAAGAGRAAPGAARSNLPILTLDRFEQAMQIARLAAEHDLPELSLKAVHDSLRAGPPIVANENKATNVRMMRAGVDDVALDPASPRVVANLMQLDPIWKKHKFAAAGVYEVLRDAVMPPARPTELFLYATPLAANSLRAPQSAGKLLAAWAVRAGKSSELRQAIAARERHVMAQLPSLILTAQLAAAADDTAGLLKALRALEARMKNDTSRTTSELACHAASPVLEHKNAEVAKAAIRVLDACSKGLETSGQPEPVSSLFTMLARREFGLGDQAGGAEASGGFSRIDGEKHDPVWRGLRFVYPQAAARTGRRRVCPGGAVGRCA